MTYARAHSVALLGVEGVPVEVQADLAPGLASFALIGLPDKALAEARDRVRAAVINAGEEWPQRRITVGLSPASVPKTGSGFDLAVAVAVLTAAGRLPEARLVGLSLIGELGLDGRVRPVRGVLPAVLAGADAGLGQVVVAEANAAEATLVPGVEVLGVRSLRQLIAVLCDEPVPDEPSSEPSRMSGPRLSAEPGSSRDLADVAGQVEARHAAEIAAAGAHHVLLTGPPGSGKTMIAERLPGLLPALTRAEALEVTAVHSVAGQLPAGQPLLDRPPYRAPHHSTTIAAVIGGGSGMPRPGAVSLAHRGVLFLDEGPEFPVRVLDALRQPLESGEVVIARSAGSLRLPARFQLVLAANPCPCGRFGSPRQECTCTPAMRRRYFGRISGPLLDRVDLRVTVEPVARADLLAAQSCRESTAVVAARVLEARDRAAARLKGSPWRTNAEVPGHAVRTRWRPAPGALHGAERDMERGLLTARGLDRVLRVAWTVADLRGHDRPGAGDVDMALGLRTGVPRGSGALREVL